MILSTSFYFYQTYPCVNWWHSYSEFAIVGAQKAFGLFHLQRGIRIIFLWWTLWIIKYIFPRFSLPFSARHFRETRSTYVLVKSTSCWLLPISSSTHPTESAMSVSVSGFKPPMYVCMYLCAYQKLYSFTWNSQISFTILIIS